MNRFLLSTMVAVLALTSNSNAWAGHLVAPIGQLLAVTSASGKSVLRVELVSAPPYSGQPSCVTGAQGAAFFLIDLSTTVGQQQASLAQLFCALGVTVGIDGDGTCGLGVVDGAAEESVFQIYN